MPHGQQASWLSNYVSLHLNAVGRRSCVCPESEVEPYVNPLILRLVPLLLSNKAARSLAENAAVTIGRLGLVSPQLVAPHLEVFITNWYVVPYVRNSPVADSILQV